MQYLGGKKIAVSRRHIIAVSRRKIIAVARRKLIAVSRRKNKMFLLSSSYYVVIIILIMMIQGQGQGQGPGAKARTQKRRWAGPGRVWGVVRGLEAARRLPGGTPEAPRRHPEGTQEAPRCTNGSTKCSSQLKCKICCKC